MAFVKFIKIIKFLLFVNFIIVNFSTVNADDKLTPYKIIGGVTLNENLYISNFKELKGYPTCCTNFDFGSGLGYSAFIGGEYSFEKTLFNIPYSIDLLFYYQNLSAKYSIEEKLGNIITGNNYVEAFSEHSLEAKINSVNIEPGINFFPFSELPLNIRMGFKFGFLSGLTFKQEERIISPDWITYKETNSKVKYRYSGDIPEASEIYTAISLGFRYEALKLNNFSISPMLNFNYGLNYIVSDLDWKISSVQFGVSVSHNIPKPKDIPPMDAPLPALPLPPIPTELFVGLEIEANNKKLINNDTLIIPVKEKKFINRFILLPIVFYKVNTSEMLVAENSRRSEEDAQNRAYLSAIKYLNENKNVNLELFSSSINTENPDTVKSRIYKLVELITFEGINRNRITIKDVKIDAAKLGREEMFQDNCFLRFNFSDGTEIISYKSDTTTKLIIEPIEFSIKPKIQTESLVKTFNGSISIDNKVINNFGKVPKNTDIIVEEEYLKKNKMDFLALVEDSFNNKKSVNISLYIKPVINNHGVFENVISDFEQRNYVRQFTLGYCEFDKAEFSYVNKLAVDEITKAYKAGEIIEIIPLFDFLGTEEHNLQLANARANHTLSLLGIKAGNAVINIPKDYFFSNENPYGRMMNRTVIVRIKNISGN